MTLKISLERHPLLRSLLFGPRALRRAWIKWRYGPTDTLLERLSLLVQGPVILDAKEFSGVFSINPRSHLLHRFLKDGHYEPRVSRIYLACVQPDADIIDVGANVGFYAVAGARKLTTGRLLAAEPTSEAFSRLTENLERNGVASKSIPFKGMIGAANGQAQIHFVPGLDEYSSLGIPEHFATKDHTFLMETVPIARLDDLVIAHSLRPALIKVDVEGAEFSVSVGAQRTLSTHRPIIISEIWRKPTSADGHSGTELIRMFEDLDYVVIDPNAPRRKPGLDTVGEIICIPKEKYGTAMRQILET